MASRTIIQVHPMSDTQGFAVIDESIASHADAPTGGAINFQLNGSGHPGDAVYALFAAVASIQKEMDFTPAPGQPPAPIYLDDRAPAAQELPWEALRRAGRGFAGLDAKRPVGRIAGTPSGAPAAFTANLYRPPLRVLAINSAAGVDGVDEWKQLYEGLKANRGQTDFCLHTVLADDSIRQAIEAAGDPALSYSWLHSADPLVRRFDDMLIDEIRRFNPHILHFFCHGMAAASPMLELATKSEKVTGSARGTVILDENFFTTVNPADTNIWLVVLNCCEGASRAESCSLARRIVEIGFPAAIGMRQAVEVRDATAFCGEVYRKIGDLLYKRFGQGGGKGEIDWVTALTEPRRRICVDRVHSVAMADQVMEWTYPVIYVRHQPFHLERPNPDLGPDTISELRTEIETLVAQREQLKVVGLPEGAPADTIERINSRIDEVKTRLTGDAQPAPAGAPG